MDGHFLNKNRAASVAFVLLVAGFALLSIAVALWNPPWEAPDEPSHVLNVETLVTGHWYRIAPGQGLEPHQPPLYYLLLAGVQKISGIPPRIPKPVSATGFQCLDHDGRLIVPIGGAPLRCTSYLHSVPQNGADWRLVRLLRLPSVVFGVVVLLFTGMIARMLSEDPWTPCVAAGFVAGVPGFVFTSASVNNDGLVNLLAAVALFVVVLLVDRAPQTTRDGWPYAVALGVLTGLLLLTKLYGPVIVVAIVVAIWLATRGAESPMSRRFDLSLILAASAVLVTAWWLVQNQRWYGDPLALTSSHDYLAARLGLGLPRNYGALQIIFVDVPKSTFITFFYNSTIGKMLWIPLVGSLVCLAIRPERPDSRARALRWLLVLFALSALVALVIVALQTATFRASTAYLGLPAIACLGALGLERLHVPTVSRIAAPAIGCLATVAIYSHALIGMSNR
jgi:hypothetical protein